jgi:hypothetical protein
VAAFDYFDKYQKRQRSFISHQFRYDEYNIEESLQFFEVVARFDDFILLERMCPIAIDRRVKRIRNTQTGMNSYSMPTYQKKAIITTNQIDILCFLVNDKIEPYVVADIKDVDVVSGPGIKLDRKNTKRRIKDKKLPERLLGDKFPQTRHYAYASNLSWKHKDELVLILQYYEKIK